MYSNPWRPVAVIPLVTGTGTAHASPSGDPGGGWGLEVGAFPASELTLGLIQAGPYRVAGRNSLGRGWLRLPTTIRVKIRPEMDWASLCPPGRRLSNWAAMQSTTCQRSLTCWWSFDAPDDRREVDGPREFLPRTLESVIARNTTEQYGSTRQRRAHTQSRPEPI